jgi:hypothetical protein
MSPVDRVVGFRSSRTIAMGSSEWPPEAGVDADSLAPLADALPRDAEHRADFLERAPFDDEGRHGRIAGLRLRLDGGSIVDAAHAAACSMATHSFTLRHFDASRQAAALTWMHPPPASATVLGAITESPASPASHGPTQE